MDRNIIFLSLVFLLGVFCSASLSSENYNIGSGLVVDGGGKVSSSNYSSNVVVGVVSGSVESGNYSNRLGVFHDYGEPNSAPTIELLDPEDGNWTMDRTPVFSYVGNDTEGDSLVYDINITKEGLSICTDYGLGEVGYVGESYSPGEDLRCLSDNNDYYEWSVRACENETFELYCSDWSEVRRIDVVSLVQISLPVDSVEFGVMLLGESKNTTSLSLDPLRLRNDGNSKINVSLNASSLWDSIGGNASEYFRAKVRDFAGVASWGEVSWFNVSMITGLVIVSDLNYSDGVDALDVDSLLRVPDEESSGAKSSTINFMAELSEVYDAA